MGSVGGATFPQAVTQPGLSAAVPLAPLPPAETASRRVNPLTEERPSDECGHGTDREEEEAEQLGVYSFMKKPVDIDALVDTVKDAFQLLETCPTGGGGK